MVKQFLHSFKCGQILPATIIKQISAHQYLVKINKYELIAYSSLRFNSSSILVQIAGLMPKIHLKIIDNKLKLNDNQIKYISASGLIIDDFCTHVLSCLLNNLACDEAIEITKSISTLCKNLPDWQLIDLKSYISFCIENKNFLGKFIIELQNESKFVPPNDGLALLEIIKSFLEINPLNTIYTFKNGYKILKVNNCIVYYLYNPKNEYSIKTCRFCINNEIENVFELKQYKNKIAISFINYSGIATKMMKKYEDIIYDFFKDLQYELLSFKYIVTPKKTFYDLFLGV